MQRNTTEPPFKVGYVISSEYATICKACKGSIPINDLRLAVMVETPMTEITGYKSPDWHHFTCFFSTHRPKSIADFSCFHLICWDDQKKIQEEIDRLTAASSTSTANGYKLANNSAYALNIPPSTSTVSRPLVNNAPSSSVSTYPNNLPVSSVSNSIYSNALANYSSTALNATAYPNHTYSVPSSMSTSKMQIIAPATSTNRTVNGIVNKTSLASGVSYLGAASTSTPNNTSLGCTNGSASQFSRNAASTYSLQPTSNRYVTSTSTSTCQTNAASTTSSFQEMWNAAFPMNNTYSKAAMPNMQTVMSYTRPLAPVSTLLQLRQQQSALRGLLSRDALPQSGSQLHLPRHFASTSSGPSTAVSLSTPTFQAPRITAYPAPNSYASASSMSVSTISKAQTSSIKYRKRARRDTVTASVVPSFPAYTPETSTFTSQLNNLTSSTVGLQVKNGVAVDPQSRHAQTACVYRDPSGNVYSAVLLRTDWESGNNCFHKLQILERIQGLEYWLFQSKGEIGSPRYMYEEQLMGAVGNVVFKFERIFFEQTGNLWTNRSAFQRIHGKKIMLDVVYKPNVIADESRAPSQLVGPVQKFIRLIHQFGKTDREMESYGIQTLDLKTWPLGRISDYQIQEAYSILLTLEDHVTKPPGERTDEDLKMIIRQTNLYYSLIPHNFGTAKPPLLRTLTAVQKETEMLDSLMKTETHYSLIDAYYEKLNAKLRPLGTEEVLFEIVKTCLLNTNTNRRLEIVEIFDVERVGEDERYTPFKHLANRKMLWHGSKVINFSKILAQGLCIAPEGAAITGHCFGRGIYFSDMVAKSARYCDANPSNNNTGLLLLCEVALGNMQCVTAMTSRLRQPAAGYDSVKAVGFNYPDPQMNMTLEDGVEISLGQAVVAPTNSRTTIAYNEYVVYNEAQVKIRYLAQVTFKS